MPLHTVVQQTPSAQTPLLHSCASAHATPAAFCTVHLPPALGQKLPAAQSASVEQVPLHAVAAPLHVEGAHDDVAGRHAPEPLHVLVVSVAPVHDEPGQSPSGSVESTVELHVPFDSATPDFATEHAWHLPLQAVSQQKPSTQKPVRH